MLILSRLFHPITARPFLKNETYIEIEPCQALKPYISCFWGTPDACTAHRVTSERQNLVIPDVCMDIILNHDLRSNTYFSSFAGINDASFQPDTVDVPDVIPYFGIRFYSWAVPLFADDSMRNVLNGHVSADVYFSAFSRDVLKLLTDCSSLSERKTKAAQYLLQKINPDRQDHNVLNAVYEIMKSRGTATVQELLRYTTVSQRQFERLFQEYVGVSPKKLAGLIRYQYLWQDILRNGAGDIQSIVYKYAYTDQAHLLHDFKKYHTMTPSQARRFAFSTVD